MNEEYQIQVALVNWIKINYPNVLLTISPNGMRLPIGVAVKLKRMGYLAGTPDILIFEPRNNYNGLFIELKSKTGTLQPNQKWFIGELIKRNYKAVVCYGFEEAILVIKQYFDDKR